MNFKCRKSSSAEHRIPPDRQGSREKLTRQALLWRFPEIPSAAIFQQGGRISDHTDRMIQKEDLQAARVKSIARNQGCLMPFSSCFLLFFPVETHCSRNSGVRGADLPYKQMRESRHHPFLSHECIPSSASAAVYHMPCTSQSVLSSNGTPWPRTGSRRSKIILRGGVRVKYSRIFPAFVR